MNLIGLDVGTKRTGICLYLEGICIPNKTIETSCMNERVSGLINEYSIDRIIAGVPLSKDGEETEMSAWIRKTVQESCSSLCIDTVFYNERYSSAEAKRKIRASGLETKDDDCISACIILEDYINEEEQTIQG